MAKKNKTFRDLYAEAKLLPPPPTPLQRFLKEVAEVGGKSELTVRRWGSGEVEPDLLTKRALADHFKTTIECLFPHKK